MSEALVECIDLAPTFLEFFGGTPPSHIMEGRSLLPLLHGKPPAQWREHVFSEYDYSMQPPRVTLGTPVRDCRLFMIADQRYKLMHAPGYRPMLFDLVTDPEELHDLGEDPAHESVRHRLMDALVRWSLLGHNAVTMPDARIKGYVDNAMQLKNGIIIGIWDEAELAAERAKAGIG